MPSIRNLAPMQKGALGGLVAGFVTLPTTLNLRTEHCTAIGQQALSIAQRTASDSLPTLTDAANIIVCNEPYGKWIVGVSLLVVVPTLGVITGLMLNRCCRKG